MSCLDKVSSTTEKTATLNTTYFVQTHDICHIWIRHMCIILSFFCCVTHKLQAITAIIEMSIFSGVGGMPCHDTSVLVSCAVFFSYLIVIDLMSGGAGTLDGVGASVNVMSASTLVIMLTVILLLASTTRVAFYFSFHGHIFLEAVTLLIHYYHTKIPSSPC